MKVDTPQLSVAVTEAGLGSGTWLEQVTVRFGGHVIAGPVTSSTYMNW
jgi:hypothetical protein